MELTHIPAQRATDSLPVTKLNSPCHRLAVLPAHRTRKVLRDTCAKANEHLAGFAARGSNAQVVESKAPADEVTVSRLNCTETIISCRVSYTWHRVMIQEAIHSGGSKRGCVFRTFTASQTSSVLPLRSFHTTASDTFPQVIYLP